MAHGRAGDLRLPLATWLLSHAAAVPFAGELLGWMLARAVSPLDIAVRAATLRADAMTTHALSPASATRPLAAVRARSSRPAPDSDL